MGLFDIFNAIGLIAFAISGVYKGISKKLDLLGISVLGFLTALGGGMLRDVLAGRTPAVFSGYSDIGFALLGIVLATTLYKLSGKDISNLKTVKFSDAIGLAAFTVTGAMVGYESGFNIAGIVVLATLTGTGGGALSDLLTGEVPFILREDFYASCSIIGAVLFFILIELGAGMGTATTVTLLFTLALRTVAIVKNLSLPKVG